VSEPGAFEDDELDEHTDMGGAVGLPGSDSTWVRVACIPDDVGFRSETAISIKKRFKKSVGNSRKP
jgi:hypothetical protein